MKNQIYTGTINKTLAHMILFVGDFFCLWGLWAGFNDYMDVLTEIDNQIDIIRFNSRSGFFIVGIGMPILHFVALVDYYWREWLKKHTGLINQFVVILVVGLLAAGLFGSSWIQTRVERAGYAYCRNASGISALAKPLVYTKDMAICENLVETEKKRKKK